MGCHFSRRNSNRDVSTSTCSITTLNNKESDAVDLGQIWKDLHKCILNNDLDGCLRILDSTRINLNTVHASVTDGDQEGLSTLKIAPIHLACMFRRTRLVEIFCRYGSEINIRDKNDRTPINICIQYWPRVNPSDLYTDDGWVAAQFKRRIEEMHEHSASCLYILLHFGANPSEIIDKKGGTLLHFCAKKGLQKALQILTVAGARLESKDVDGLTPLLYGSRYGSEHMVEFMLNSCAEINVRDNCGNGLLHMLAQNEQITVDFLEHTVNYALINKANEQGQTPLMIACSLGNGEKIDVLLQKGADPSKTDTEGRSALFYLLEHNDPAFCMQGLIHVIMYTKQINVYNRNRQIPAKLGENRWRRLRTILEAESSTPSSLYLTSFFKVYNLITDWTDSNLPRLVSKVTSLNLPHKIGVELLTFRTTMRQFWLGKWGTLTQ